MSSTKNQISITDRVKTFEDACSILGPNNFTVNLYNEYICRPKQYLGEICKIQLAIICEALNEGWKPEFTVGEVTYQPAISVFFPKMNTAGIENLHTIGNIKYVINISKFKETKEDTKYRKRTYDQFALNTPILLKSAELAQYCAEQFICTWLDMMGYRSNRLLCR